jgi:RNA polymerase sigma factor for flagellar operon FliA
MTMTSRDPRLLPLLTKVRAMAMAIGRLTDGGNGSDELVSAGYLGVATAISRQQGDLSAAFEGYCLTHARGAVFDELRRRDKMGRADRRRVCKVAKAIRLLRNQLGREPEDLEVAAEMKLDLKTYRHLREQMEYRAVDVGAPGEETLRDESDSAEEIVQKRERAAIVARFLREAKAKLSPRQAETIELSFGAEQSSVAVAKALGLSEGRISQLRKVALGRLLEMGCANDAFYQEVMG